MLKCHAITQHEFCQQQKSSPWFPKPMLPGLKVAQAIHNLALSGFSLACFLGTLHACLAFEWAAPQSQGGLYGAICVEAGEHTTDAVSKGLRTWFLWYQLSKYWEFMDTVLLIINRKPVSFLHAYHHTVVAFTSWTWTRAGEYQREHTPWPPWPLRPPRPTRLP